MNALAQSRRLKLATGLAGTLALAICAAGALIDSNTFFAAWLVAWWTCAGAVLGSQANLWLHALTGGSWLLPIRYPLRNMAGTIPMLSVLLLLFFPAFLFFYPWSHQGWSGALPHSIFKTAWLDWRFITVRMLAYAALWNVLIRYSSRQAGSPRKGYSALGLLVFGYSISLAAVDLIMSLMPHWYSSGFGLLAVTAQMKAAFALAVFLGARSATRAQRRDLGNLLLMYVLMWAYLEFVQFQIIWAENLPHEIAWYVPRLLTSWRWLGIVQVVCGFFLPLILLLFRSLKENGICLQIIAGVLCVMSYSESIWLILPSVHDLSLHIVWMSPLALTGMAAVLLSSSASAAGLPAQTTTGQGSSDAKTVR